MALVKGVTKRREAHLLGVEGHLYRLCVPFRFGQNTQQQQINNSEKSQKKKSCLSDSHGEEECSKAKTKTKRRRGFVCLFVWHNTTQYNTHLFVRSTLARKWAHPPGHRCNPRLFSRLPEPAGTSVLLPRNNQQRRSLACIPSPHSPKEASLPRLGLLMRYLKHPYPYLWAKLPSSLEDLDSGRACLGTAATQGLVRR